MPVKVPAGAELCVLLLKVIPKELSLRRLHKNVMRTLLEMQIYRPSRSGRGQESAPFRSSLGWIRGRELRTSAPE